MKRIILYSYSSISKADKKKLFHLYKISVIDCLKVSNNIHKL